MASPITVELQHAGDGEALRNSPESSAQTRRGEPLLLFVVLLLTRGCLTENIVCMGQVGPDITVFQAPGSASFHSQ